jgi:hypothetical protein
MNLAEDILPFSRTAHSISYRIISYWIWHR